MIKKKCDLTAAHWLYGTLYIEMHFNSIQIY